MARQPRHRQAYLTHPASLPEKFVGHPESMRRIPPRFCHPHHRPRIRRLLQTHLSPAQTHAMFWHVGLTRRLWMYPTMPTPCTLLDFSALRLTSLDTLEISYLPGRENALFNERAGLNVYHHTSALIRSAVLYRVPVLTVFFSRAYLYGHDQGEP